MKKKLIQHTTKHFEKLFQKKPKHIFLSPGRINIIGEHVDYNDGFVLPAAINKYICFAISKNKNSECALVAQDLNEVYSFDIKDKLQPIEKMWVNYILGVLHQLKEKGLPENGFTVVFSSTIPMGAGLSSSAALECGIAYAMNKMFDLKLSKEEIARIGQKAEHTFAGVNCGIMDQFASVFGEKNKVIKLDCTTLTYEYHNANFKEYQLVLFDSCVKHTHLTSGYNDRRNEVEQGFAIIKANYPEVTSFRNCTEKMVLSLKDTLGEIIFNRCLFVVQEIERVQLAVNALTEGDIEQLGKLMTKTHHGLSELYEVSCPEMDFLVSEANKTPEIIGARMMGGGFGGCTINLVKKENVTVIIEKMKRVYATHYNIDLKFYKIKIANGATEYAI
jgi:galactokinase